MLPSDRHRTVGGWCTYLMWAAANNDGGLGYNGWYDVILTDKGRQVAQGLQVQDALRFLE